MQRLLTGYFACLSLSVDVSPSFGDMGIAVHNVIVKSSILKKDGDNELQAADSGGNGGTAISTSVTEATVAPDVHTDASSLHFQLILHACWLLIKVSVLRWLFSFLIWGLCASPLAVNVS